jgi:hypothetical protein
MRSRLEDPVGNRANRGRRSINQTEGKMLGGVDWDTRTAGLTRNSISCGGRMYCIELSPLGAQGIQGPETGSRISLGVDMTQDF